jgi:hypothetical protein
MAGLSPASSVRLILAHPNPQKWQVGPEALSSVTPRVWPKHRTVRAEAAFRRPDAKGPLPEQADLPSLGVGVRQDKSH